MLITARYTEVSQPLTSEDLTTLATYNSERSRGIVHRPEWNRRMELLQAQFDAHNRWKMQQDYTELAPGLWVPKGHPLEEEMQLETDYRPMRWYDRRRLVPTAIFALLLLAVVIWILLIQWTSDIWAIR